MLKIQRRIAFTVAGTDGGLAYTSLGCCPTAAAE
jgi:hypothetical protein